MSETPLIPHNPNPRDLKSALKALLARVFVVLETDLIPPPPQNTDYLDLGPAFGSPGQIARENAATGRPFMALCHAEQLLTHIRRVEYCLRAFILHLAAQFLENCDISHISHPPSHTATADQSRSESDRKTNSFILFAAPSRTRGKSRTSRFSPPIRSTWTEIDISHLISRLQCLPAAIRSAEARARRLATRLRKGKLETGTHVTNRPRITTFNREPQMRGFLPRFFRQLEVWHPPPELYERALESERDALNRLHLLAGEALLACAK